MGARDASKVPPNNPAEDFKKERRFVSHMGCDYSLKLPMLSKGFVTEPPPQLHTIT
jgi:hypothetical protein